MLVKQTNRTSSKAQHSEPIYFVGLESTSAGLIVITSTQSATQTAPDNFPATYEQRLNANTGAVTCSCQGFQESIAWKAQRDGVTPTIANGRTCKHIRKAAESGREWGYLDSAQPIVARAKAAPGEIDHATYFGD